MKVNKLSNMHVDIELRRKHARAAIHEVVVSWRKQEGEQKLELLPVWWTHTLSCRCVPLDIDENGCSPPGWCSSQAKG
jgi:hypothetical protein